MPAIAPPDKDAWETSSDELFECVPGASELLVLLPFELDPFVDDDVSMGRAA
jgi:hypothetical protein